MVYPQIFFSIDIKLRRGIGSHKVSRVKFQAHGKQI